MGALRAVTMCGVCGQSRQRAGPVSDISTSKFLNRLIKCHDKINNQTQIDPMFAAVPKRTDVAATRFARPYMFANKYALIPGAEAAVMVAERISKVDRSTS